MERCPVCRATLNGAETCRRCRVELQSAIRAEREGRMLVDAAIHSLSLDDAGTAERLLQRALTVHATPEARVLRRLVAALPSRSETGEGRTGAVDDAVSGYAQAISWIAGLQRSSRQTQPGNLYDGLDEAPD
jgi:hypothetical protein